MAICLFLPFNKRIEDRWGDLLGSWLRYHLQVLDGIRAVFLYDLDGALASRKHSWPPGVIYQPFFARRIFPRGLANMSLFPRCPYCAEALAYDHCMMSSRGLVDYALVLQGLNKWLVPKRGAGLNLAASLDRLGPRGAYAYLRARHLHTLGRNGSRGRSPNLVLSAVYRHRRDGDGFFPSHQESIPWWCTVRPEGLAYMDTHIAIHEPQVRAERESLARHLEDWRVNYYVDNMDPRYWDGSLLHDGEAPIRSLGDYVEDRRLVEILVHKARYGSRPAAAILEARGPGW